tara:strand:- start:12190 stop:13647 length:1458 start_codon:yes stop_codon:yes gene_type:complete
MATFTTKKISETVACILHGDDGSSNVRGLTNASTNVELRTSNNGVSTINITTDKVSLNQSCVVAGGLWNRSSGQDLDVRSSSTAGAGGTIFAGEVTVWQGSSTAWGTQSQGGKVNFKDGSSAPDSGTSDDSFFIDNYHSGEGFALRCTRRESGGAGAGTDEDTRLFTATAKNGQAYFTVGTVASLEQFTCEGKLSTAGTSLGPRINEIYVNSRTSNFGTLLAGDDDNPGTKLQPYKTLSKAIVNCCPYSINIIYLYAGTNASSEKTTYNICTLTLKGLNIHIRPCHSDTPGSKEVGDPVATDEGTTALELYRDATIVQQSISNELEVGGADADSAQWDLWNGTAVSMSGFHIKLTYPGASGYPLSKLPFRMVFNGGGLLSLGEQNSTDCQSTKVDYVSYNGSQANTAILTSEYSYGHLITKNVKYASTAGDKTKQALLSGPGTLNVQQTGQYYPDNGLYSGWSGSEYDQYDYIESAGTVGTNYTP